MSETKSVLRLNDAVVFQGETLVLQNVNIQVNAGELVYLVGKTGSGKSSLLKTLYADLPLKEGSGIIADFDLTKLKRKQIAFLRRKLGIVFQDFNLLSDRNVYQNLWFILESIGWKKNNEMDHRIKDVLKLVSLQGKEHKMIHELSGGEQQRLVIARAILNKPEVILADEPTGNLDPDVTDNIMELLYEICRQGTGMLIATHDYRIIKKFPGKIYRCDENKIEEVRYTG
ncbi:MAG: ATP-binding cassette domain-containing protein [Flavobacteriales bacterium]|nr:ATP-binding cassette domain-containing protein [Flavobacteriales bacterium]